MDIIDKLLEKGFERVLVLNGADCDLPFSRILLALMVYPAPKSSCRSEEAVIHNYYPVSQAAYLAAKEAERELLEAGLDLHENSGIRIKRILYRVPGLLHGRNTLSYTPEYGSRFHVQIFTTGEKLPTTHTLTASVPPTACGECRKCMQACPTGAIRPEGFSPENCLRYWMLNGKTPPDRIARKMGNRLIGCDECESCCPMNRQSGEFIISLSLKSILEGKETSRLRQMIGANYAIPNRILAQACILAGSLHRDDLLPELLPLLAHASPLVRSCAEWAVNALTKAQTDLF